MGVFCDAGCEVHFTKSTVTVTYQDHIVLTGTRTPTTRLWFLQPPPIPPTMECAMGAIGSATPAEIVAFSHAALFSPALSTLEHAVKSGFLTNFPGLTLDQLRKHPPRSIATAKGHLDQTRKNQRSTKVIVPAVANDDQEDFSPIPFPAGIKTHHCFAAVFEPTGQIYTDQTGRFISPSSTGNNYLMILYDFDSNAILVAPMKNRQAASIVAAYKVLHTRLCAAGFRPSLQRLDNECSQALKDFMTTEHVDYQLVPPGVHRRNAAERAIRTFQNHFIAGLCSVDKDFPLHLWDQLLPQAEITLNLLRASRINPKLSAWAQLRGTFDFNRTPLAPPGIRVLAHEKPKDRTTWSAHGLDGWYVGPALDSYRCYRIWIWTTRTIRICDTVAWFPTKVTMPIASSTDLVLAGIQDIVNALKNPSHGSPLAPRTDSQVQALTDLSNLLTNIATKSPPNETPVTNQSGPPLRVEEPPVADTQMPPTSQSVPALRVAELTVQTQITPALRVDTQEPDQVKPPVPTNEDNATIDNSTGPRGKQRRRSQSKTKGKNKPKARTEPSAAVTTDTANAAVTPINDSIHYCLHGTAINPDTGTIADYAELSTSRDGPAWIASMTDEFGRLCQGLGPNSDMPTGSETMFFIPKHSIPKGRTVTYARVVCADRPEKTNPKRVRITCGGDRIEFPGDVSTKTADIVTVKVLLNSVISTPGARFMTGDLKDFYLGTPMERFEYMRISVKIIPRHIYDLYKLKDLTTDGFVFVEIRRGMYGLPQAGRIANDQLVAFLAPHGYHPVAITPGLWKHDTRDIFFTLVVDDFGVKYTNRDDADHLMNTLKLHYKVSEDWDGLRYCGLTIAWDYDNKTCDISMPGYIERALQRFCHDKPSRPQHAPHTWEKPQYGAKTQYAPAPDTTPALSAEDTTRVQQVLGTLLYYGRAIDNTILTAVGSIATQQASGTAATMKAITHLLNYCATHPEATVRFIASDMVLWVDSDASYLSENKARSRAGGFHFLSNRPKHPDIAPTANDAPPPNNGPIHVLCQIMREVVSSAAEAELGALFHNAKEACPIRTSLEELGHPQPPTPIQTDNSTAHGIANDTVKQKRSKAIDMRFYWVRDRVRQKQFHIFWQKGSLSRADYFTKHHPASHHQTVRPFYLHTDASHNDNYYQCLLDDTTDDAPMPPSIAATNNFESDSHAVTAAGEGVLIPGSPQIHFQPLIT